MLSTGYTLWIQRHIELKDGCKEMSCKQKPFCLPHTRARGWALQLGGWAWAGSAERVAVSEAGPQRAWGIRACPACHLGLRSSYHTGDARAEWTMCHLRGTGSEEEEGGMRGTSWTSLARWVGVFKGYFFLTTNYKK